MKTIKVKTGDVGGACALAAYWATAGSLPRGIVVSQAEVKQVARKVTVKMLEAMAIELKALGFEVPSGARKLS